MGGAVSTGIDNDDLTDNLRQAAYIRTPTVARVFRAVDRGEYILPEFRIHAYKDQAWRCNHLHLSAPCIYCEVMEGLCLVPGISFLNLGSGTGYLSTMAGLIIGSNGINHGIEYYEDVITYANAKLDDFKRHSGAIDEFDFCEPKFFQGNCLCLTNDRQYDRVYVGAACTEPYDIYMKNLLRVGGILVMPLNEHLLQIKRTSKNTWETCSMLSVSFARLIPPKDGCKETMDPMEIEPQSLQSICRSAIRNILRHNIDAELPELKNRKQSSPVLQGNKCAKVPYINNVIYEPNDSESEQDVREYLGVAVDLIVGDRPARVLRRKMHRTYLNTWMKDAVYETDSSEDEAKMEPVALNVRQRQETPQPRPQPPQQTVEERDETAAAGIENGAASGAADGTKQGRQKFDSGLGDESQSDEVMSWKEDDYPDGDLDNNGWRSDDSTRAGFSWRRIDEKCVLYQDNSSSSTSENENGVEEDEEELPVADDACVRRAVASPYTMHMLAKIQELPLPPILKDYLNFYRV